MRKFLLSAAAAMLAAVCAAEVEMPLIIGHRGDREFGFQNTMSAYQAAWKNGVKAVEIDVRTTADGKLICFHDADFIKTANDRRKVNKLTYKEILAIDIGSSKHPMFKNEKPPLLEDFFAAMPKDTHVVVELKNNSTDENFPYVLRDLMKKYNIAQSQLTVVSFNEELLKNLNRKVPGMRNMLIVGLGACRQFGMKAPANDPNLVLDKILAKLKEIGCTGISFGASDKRIKYDDKFLKALTAAGYELSVWTVNDTWDVYNLAKAGAVSVTTDRPSTMKQAWEKLFGKQTAK